MTANINTILILGATSGLGEAFARYFHSKGKKVIASGRRVERLKALKCVLPGLETVQIDVEDIPNLESNLKAIIKSYPDLDAVLVMSGKMEIGFFKDASSTSTKGIVSEVTTNLIAPLVIARTLIPPFAVVEASHDFHTCQLGTGICSSPLLSSLQRHKSWHSFIQRCSPNTARRNECQGY